MVKLLLFLLITYFHISNGVEINAIELDEALQNEVQQSAAANKKIASAFENFDKSTWTETAKVLPQNFLVIENEIQSIASSVSGVLNTLKTYQNTHAQETIYLPDKLLKDIEIGLNHSIEILGDIKILYSQYTSQIADDKIYSDSGLIWFPQHPQGGLFQILYELEQYYMRLQNTCNYLETALIDASDYMQTYPAAEHIFALTSKAFGQHAQQFSAIVPIIAQELNEFNSIALYNNRGKIAFPQRQTIKDFNIAFMNTGHLYSSLAKDLISESSKQKHSLDQVHQYNQNKQNVKIKQQPKENKQHRQNLSKQYIQKQQHQLAKQQSKPHRITPAPKQPMHIAHKKQQQLTPLKKPTTKPYTKQQNLQNQPQHSRTFTMKLQTIIQQSPTQLKKPQIQPPKSMLHIQKSQARVQEPPLARTQVQQTKAMSMKTQLNPQIQIQMQSPTESQKKLLASIEQQKSTHPQQQQKLEPEPKQTALPQQKTQLKPPQIKPKQLKIPPKQVKIQTKQTKTPLRGSKAQPTKPQIHLQQPQTQTPPPQTLTPQPKTLTPQPKTLTPQPQTQTPQPQTQKLQPKTQTPKPSMQRQQSQPQTPQPPSQPKMQSQLQQSQQIELQQISQLPEIKQLSQSQIQSEDLKKKHHHHHHHHHNQRQTQPQRQQMQSSQSKSSSSADSSF